MIVHFQEKNILVGTVNIPVANVNSRSHIEKWYQVQNDARAPSKDQAALRIKCKFQSIDILPMELYSDFIQVCYRQRFYYLLLFIFPSFSTFIISFLKNLLDIFPQVLIFPLVLLSVISCSPFLIDTNHIP